MIKYRYWKVILVDVKQKQKVVYENKSINVRIMPLTFTERNILGAKQSQVKKCGHLTQSRQTNAALEQFEVKYFSRFSSQISTVNKILIAYDRHFGLKQGNEMLSVSKPNILLDSSN